MPEITVWIAYNEFTYLSRRFMVGIIKIEREVYEC
jgi:hypothetical protein